MAEEDEEISTASLDLLGALAGVSDGTGALPNTAAAGVDPRRPDAPVIGLSPRALRSRPRLPIISFAIWLSTGRASAAMNR
jgi:hypothetical protein